MVKLVGPLHSVEARGRLDSLVYGTWRGIRFCRQHVDPVFSTPDCRTAQKARVASANAAWKLLTSNQHLDWHIYAQAHPRLDWSGVLIRISGYNCFVSCYTICLRSGGTPLSSPPSVAPPLPLTSLSSSQIVNDIRIAWTFPSQPTSHTYKLQLLKTGPISLGKRPDSHHASILTHEALNSSPYDDPLTLDGRYGYWARVIDSDTGLTTPFLSCCTDFVYSPPVTPTTVSGYLWDGSYPVPYIDVTCDLMHTSSLLDGTFLFTGVSPGLRTITPATNLGEWSPPGRQINVISGQDNSAGTFLLLP